MSAPAEGKSRQLTQEEIDEAKYMCRGCELGLSLLSDGQHFTIDEDQPNPLQTFYTPTPCAAWKIRRKEFGIYESD